MLQDRVFTIFKSLLVKSKLNDNPSLGREKLEEIRQEIDAQIDLSTPMSAIGLDSMTMTWLLVNIEEELGINTACFSFFEIYDVNDFVNDISALANQQAVANA